MSVNILTNKTDNKKDEKRTQRYYADLLLMLIAPIVMAWYYYGQAVFRTLALSVLTAVACELIFSFLIKKPNALKDLNAVFVGIVIPLMLPANVSPWFAAMGSAFAIIVAKMPFGGTKSAPFMPAAAGFAFLCLCNPEKVFFYPPVGIVTESTVSSGASLASMLNLNHTVGLNAISLFNVFIGNIPGPMGATCALVLVGAIILILIRQPVYFINTIGFIVGCAVPALLFPRVLNGVLSSLIFELCSGMLLFTAIFLITDPATSPKKIHNRFFYGITAGIICMAIRHYGVFEESACFAVLIASAIWPLVNNIAENILKFFVFAKKQAASRRTR